MCQKEPPGIPPFACDPRPRRNSTSLSCTLSPSRSLVLGVGGCRGCLFTDEVVSLVLLVVFFARCDFRGAAISMPLCGEGSQHTSKGLRRAAQMQPTHAEEML